MCPTNTDLPSTRSHTPPTPPDTRAIKFLALVLLLVLGSPSRPSPLMAQVQRPDPFEPPPARCDAPPVTAPPDRFFEMISNRLALANPSHRHRTADDTHPTGRANPGRPTQNELQQELALYRTFYRKYLDIHGLPVVAHADVADLALQRTYEIVTHMLAGRPDILHTMVTQQMYLIIIGKHQRYTDMPEYRHHPDPDFINERVRGTGGNPTSFGEENLLSLPIDRYDDESIAVHEFAHTIDAALRHLDPAWPDRLRAAYENARSRRLWHLTYAETNPAEYWAELVQCYFDCNRTNNWNHGPIGTREALRAHDPIGYQLVHETLRLPPHQDWRYRWLQPLPAVTTPPRIGPWKQLDPWYTEFTWAREFPILARSARDEALLHANHTLRRMFAYRHDILKALIQDGLKLVILAPTETLADLPEFRNHPQTPTADPSNRSPGFYPQQKLLVVHEENVLANPHQPGQTDNQIVAIFAEALHRVAGTRPVLTNFRPSQQYELRVKRLDETFDQRLTQLHRQALAQGRWQNSPAARNPSAYWVAGVLAYFDAAGARNHSTDPLPKTREQLQQYDPDLYSLVHETMAFEGRPDWRYEPWSPPAANTSPPQRAGTPRIYRARFQPHWFDQNRQFWYRNDLPGNRREFILVHAEQGRREPAFDHQAVARQMGPDTDPERLPIEELQFSEDGRSVLLIGRTRAWRLDRLNGTLTPEPTPPPVSGDLTPEQRPRPSRRTGPETEIVFVNQLDQPVRIFWLDEDGRRQPYGTLEPGARRTQHTYSGHVWLLTDTEERPLAVFEATDTPATAVLDRESLSRRRTTTRAPRPPAGRSSPTAGERVESPDGRFTAFVRNHNIHLQRPDGSQVTLTSDGSPNHTYTHLSWSPDGRVLLAWRMQPVETGEVYLIRSSPAEGGRARLERRPYALPGDPFPKYEPHLFHIDTGQRLQPAVDPFEHQWLRPRVYWNRAGTRFSWLQIDRGHQRLRVIEVDAQTGSVRNLIEERSQTFIWTAHTESLDLNLVTWLEKTDELLYVSERDGWRHLYLVDMETANMHQITQGPWIVRGIQFIDEDNRQIWFSAGGKNPDQDPYYLHFYRVNFDGTGLVALTEANGTHQVQFSPDRRFLIDTWSRIDHPPVTELRRASDGRLVRVLEQADITELSAAGWTAPIPFVAKGRDGQTDIYGVIHPPRPLDPHRKYPILESIYAGPQGFFVPKAFSPTDRFAWLTEAGFVVVQIDGMGTAHRSKAFHDVCYKNLKDAGLPDRILWIQAAARQYPWMDLDRVGVFGHSAGGQNAAAAVLFHGDFYKAAVASCGCHDNRLDKASWNEQWMGYMPADQIWQNSPDNWYARSSNIENAHRLQGKLLLMVGELDTNVPPENTLRFVDALIRADKDFEFLLLPNTGHSMGGAYGQRRIRDFFLRHLGGPQPAAPPAAVTPDAS
ncbi:prolyl oligopeptidase family serine peptidase [Limisphaera ngatamarikiensis]|uniref:Prolyl oligopeptidase family serine peptidase n=1 Tax=Limisphaera ngatamarikiensis TaxID=1324935 RepID=A0A6M1RTJ3_9BACT|nr:prolyl oligopeptidase family serine peptidase [Limisphaera ngatamarikiensis]NGO38724.1 prolyl oligopeptidase family serine peptidase [Limisphaera ngatamarikiensis]